MTTEYSTIMIPKNHIQSLSNEKNIYIYKKTIKKDTVQSKIIFCDPDSTYGSPVKVCGLGIDLH